MKHLLTIIIIFTAMVAAMATGPEPWVHIYTTDNTLQRVHSTKTRMVKSITYTADANDSVSALHIMRHNDKGNTTTYLLNDVTEVEIGPNVPTIYIYTVNHKKIKSKFTYVEGEIMVDGNGLYPDLELTPMRIRGRGNTSWNYPKKPYRLNFNTGKVSLLGMTKAKNYVLLANYIDGSMMRNAVAFWFARTLGIPYSNEVIPVNVVLNDTAIGSYILTHKVGISKASVNIDDQKGWLIELDSYYDEPHRMYSQHFKLPVMFKDPDPAEIATASRTEKQILSLWQRDFNEMEEAVYNGEADLSPWIDIESAANFMLVYSFCGNPELCHPKSVYLYKPSADDPYRFGPVWDFDWAFDYWPATHNTPDSCIIHRWVEPGRRFFHALATNAKIDSIVASRKAIIAEHLDEFWQFFDSYARTIKPQAPLNSEIWPPQGDHDDTGHHPKHLESLRTYLKARIDFVLTDSCHGIYRTVY